VDYQALLIERAEVVDDIVETISKLGTLVRQEAELRNQLMRIQRDAGSTAEPFSTATSVADAVCAELGRAGLSLYRADPRICLPALVDSQHSRYADQMTVRKQGSNPSVA
jgi:hypothetical protein